MWLSDFGAGFLSGGGWIYSQFAGRPTKATNKSVLFLVPLFGPYSIVSSYGRFLKNDVIYAY
jgi:hypothetical protein